MKDNIDNNKENSGRPPNILLIIAEDLGYGDLGCYGSENHATPALDSLAADGIRFTDYYSPAACCSPSRAAMLTGSYPVRIGMETGCGVGVLRPGDPIGLNPEEETLPKLLQRQGYTTRLVGKWHCGDQKPFLPLRHGFETFYGLPYSNDQGRSRSFPDMPPLPLMWNDEVLEEQPDQSSLTDRFTESAVRFIRENKDRPFFLQFSHMYVHVPIHAPEPFLERSKDGPYGAAVEHMDFSAGVLLRELERLGLTENTLVVFTTDHGATRTRVEFGSNRPLRGHKGRTFEGGFRVPCLMRMPGTIPAGRVCNQLVNGMDLLPTLVGLAWGTIPPEPKRDGMDMRQLWTDPEGSGWDPERPFFYYQGAQLAAVRSGPWKLHIRRYTKKETPPPAGSPLQPAELYNLDEDIAESNDVAADHPAETARLLQLAEDCRKDLGDATTAVTGANRRPCGRVESPEPLTRHHPDHPYMVPLYNC